MMKAMPTLGVFGVITGFTLKERAMSEIHEVFDHLYPGIGIIGLLMVADSGREELMKQFPEVADYPKCTEDNWETYAAMVLEKHGPTMMVRGNV